MAIEIREATIADVAQIIAIGRDTYRQHFADIWHNMDTFLDQDFSCAAVTACVSQRDKHRYLLAWKENELVGFAKLNLDTQLPGQTGHGVELQKIYLTQAAVGHHLGSQLLQTSLQIAATLQRSYVWLDVLKSNHSAQQFYRRHQFTVTGEIPFSTDCQEIGMWVMVRPLTAAELAMTTPTELTSLVSAS